jgi:hypothetical protein
MKSEVKALMEALCPAIRDVLQMDCEEFVERANEAAESLRLPYRWVPLDPGLHERTGDQRWNVVVRDLKEQRPSMRAKARDEVNPAAEEDFDSLFADLDAIHPVPPFRPSKGRKLEE